MKTVTDLEKEIEKKKAKLRAYESRLKYTEKKLKLKERELRDQVRYLIGGLVLDHNYCDIFSGLRDKIYNDAITRDKKKLVSFGFYHGNISELSRINIKECKESAKNAGIKTDLTEKELGQIETALAPGIYQKVYGKGVELFVYTAPNQKFYISDNVGKYLIDVEGFTT